MQQSLEKSSHSKPGVELKLVSSIFKVLITLEAMKQVSRLLIKIFDKSKQRHDMKLHLDSSKGYYSSRVGLNMCPLTTGEYTIVFELYFPSASINRSTVQIPAISNIETVTRISTNTLSNHNRSITHSKLSIEKLSYPKIDMGIFNGREKEMLLISKRQFLTIKI